MKKVLFFAAMLSFAVACGGGVKSANNAEEAAVEAPEAVEEVAPEAAEEAVPEVKAEAAPEIQANEKAEMPKLTVNKVIEGAKVEAAEVAEEVAEEAQFQVTEIKEKVKLESATIGKDKKKVVETNLKVSETPVAKGVAVSK